MSKSRPSGNSRIPWSEAVFFSGSNYGCGPSSCQPLYLGSATSKTMAKGPTGLPRILQKPLDPCQEKAGFCGLSPRESAAPEITIILLGAPSDLVAKRS